MSCPETDLDVCVGETFRRTFLYTDVNDVPIDISTWTLTFTVGSTVYVSGVDAEVTNGPGTGFYSVMLTSTDAAALSTVTSYSIVGTNPAAAAGEGDVLLSRGRLLRD